jgi:hypothetical protein
VRGRWKTLLGSLALVALVLLAWAQWRADRAAAPGTLLAIAPESVERIGIALPGQPVQHYERRDGHWWRQGAKPQRAGANGWLDRAAAIAAAPVQRWRAVRGLDLHTLGLKPPRLTLWLNGHRLDYGTMTPFRPGRYVRVGDRIAVIPAQYTPQPQARKVTLPDTD